MAACPPWVTVREARINYRGFQTGKSAEQVDSSIQNLPQGSSIPTPGPWTGPRRVSFVKGGDTILPSSPCHT